jgi:hypothetical protein
MDAVAANQGGHERDVSATEPKEVRSLCVGEVEENQSER